MRRCPAFLRTRTLRIPITWPLKLLHPKIHSNLARPNCTVCPMLASLCVADSNRTNNPRWTRRMSRYGGAPCSKNTRMSAGLDQWAAWPRGAHPRMRSKVGQLRMRLQSCSSRTPSGAGVQAEACGADETHRGTRGALSHKGTLHACACRMPVCRNRPCGLNLRSAGGISNPSPCHRRRRHLG